MVLLVLLFALASCATTEKVETVVEEPVVETLAEPVAAKAVVEEVAAKPAIEVVEKEHKPLAIWQASNLELTKDGKPVYIPKKYLNPVFVEIFEHEYVKLVMGKFRIAAIYELNGTELKVTPVYYENVNNELLEFFENLGIKLPIDYYFTGELNDDVGVLNAEALGYDLSVTWVQVM